MLDLNLKLGRKVLAVKSVDGICKGEVYNISGIEVGHSCSYAIIDGERYNTVLFDEIADSPLMQALSSVKVGNAVRVIAKMKEAKTLNLSLCGQVVIIRTEVLGNMEVGDVLTIGRLENCDVRKDDNNFQFFSTVSRMHCIVYREAEESYRVLDCSSFGTEVCL